MNKRSSNEAFLASRCASVLTLFDVHLIIKLRPNVIHTEVVLRRAGVDTGNWNNIFGRTISTIDSDQIQLNYREFL